MNSSSKEKSLFSRCPEAARMISVVVPSFNRSKVAKLTYKMSTNRFIRHVYVIGSSKPYLFEDSADSVVSLFRPGVSLFERLREGVAASTSSHVVMMSDDDIIEILDDSSRHLSSAALVIPQVVYTSNSVFRRSLEQLKFRLYSIIGNDYFWPAIKSNLVVWYAVFPRRLCDEMLCVPGTDVNSFLVEKMMLCAIYAKGLNISISHDIRLVRSKKLISKDQGVRDESPPLSVYRNEMDSVFKFIRNLIRESDSNIRRKNLECYLDLLEQRANICIREYKDIKNPFRFTVCGGVGRLATLSNLILIALSQAFPLKINAKMRLYADASDLFSPVS